VRNPLSLHQLNALDVSPVELIDIAGRVGAPHVCLFTHSGGPLFPSVTVESEHAVVKALKRANVEVYNVEYIAITPEMNFDGLAVAFALTRRIGGKRMTVHNHDPFEARAVESFRKVCGLAADEGVAVGLEWTAVNTAIDSLGKAVRFLALAQAPNAALAVDLLHLIRSGGAPADLKTLPARLIGYAQISDGPLRRSLEAYSEHELIVERLPPGDGAFPTAEFIAAIPPGVVVEVEAPQTAARNEGVSAYERCRRSVEAARRFVPR
jgi:sugar phosphate isomerase/epimerase